MGDSESSLFSFFFYVLFVYPATNWLLKPGRFSRTKGLTYAISLLVAIAAVKTGLELKEQGPNYYQLMKVGRSATALEIKRSYKKMSLELHPDKNPSATALDDFATLKNAYDVLMDMDAREVYDRFGPEKLKQKVAVIDEYKVLVEVAIFYAAWGIMTWMLTLGKHNSNARQWVFTGMIAMLVVEVMMLLKEIELPAWFLPAMTAHELIQLGHNLFPAFLNGCRCIGAYLFVDLDGHQRALLGALHEQNKEVLRALRDIQTSIQNGGGAGPARPMSVGDAMRNLEAELEGKDIKHPSEVNIFSDGFPDGKKKSNANLYLMIGGYIVLYYIFAGNQAASA
ncbi:unnamed protein product [Pelagomonas calceolata]|uniref:J domain-containing protein n=1 Tax=Pelagomonas calceolata TaxID=35677 RepID=A0A8J2WF40_9STRA|nr:unnamed protein product [Pelagomonas calceolata]